MNRDREKNRQKNNFAIEKRKQNSNKQQQIATDN